MSFENSALLVKLQIGKWTGKKDDKSSEREIAANHNVQGTFGEVRKDLVSRVAFKPIQEAESAIRSHHSKYTQPWATGVAILPSTVYFTYVSELSRLKDNYQRAVDAFVLNYDVLKSDSRLRLGDKYDADEYPTADALRSKFYVQVDFIPLASTGGITLDLAEAELQRVKDAYSKTLKDMEHASVAGAWDAISGSIDNLIERLQDPTTARLNTMERLKDTAKLLKQMNTTKSNALDTVCDDVINMVCICDMASIKDDTLMQQTVMDAAKEVRKKIDQLRPQK